MPSFKEAAKIGIIAVVAVAIAKRIPFTAAYL
jgi:hypothetical protein